MTAIYQFTHAIVLAALALVCFPQVNPQAASPSEFYLISVEECGNLAREGHLVRGENGEIPVRSAPGASLEERTYSGGDVVVYRYSGLPSS